MDFQGLHNKLKETKEAIIPSQGLEKGISVIVPAHEGMEFIEDCLTSLNSQNIYDAKFEVVIVLNGIFQKELEYLHNTKFENLDLTIFINDEASAGAARNIGMKSAKYSHITFVDIDDYVSTDYIQSHYDYLENNKITFSQIYDVEDDEIIEDNPINLEVIRNDGPENVSIMNLNRVATITVCKVIPKEIATLQYFKENLLSGEDTVYYSELFVNSRPKLKVVPIEKNSIYYRRVRDQSVSRKPATYDFMVFQRFEILEILDTLLELVNNPTLRSFIQSKYNAQISFMNRFLVENFNKREEILNVVKSMSLKYFNYSILNRDFAKTLVLSYCFPPFSDTSATIASKRIIENNEVVDVVSNNLSRIRHKEPSLNNMIKPYVGSKTVVNQPATFSNMYYLDSYIDAAFRFYLKNMERYQKVYSRAMFPISHIPNLFIKIVNPNIEWVAEFSDPLLYNIESTERFAEIKHEKLVASLKTNLLGKFGKYVDDNLFNLSEIIPFALADKLIFTNENQLEFMISRFEEDEKEYIRSKSIISNHPTLPKEFYHMDDLSIDIEESIVNVAYFGNFYSKRSYHEFINLVNQLNENFELTFKLHIYTNTNQLESDAIDELIKNNVKVHEYLSFREFLNATTKFDMLLISDAITSDDKPYNPYLPSKLSDYLGSGTPILALTENTSVMSKMKNESLYKIDLLDFRKMINNKNIKDNQNLNELVDNINGRKMKNDGRRIYNKNNKLTLMDHEPLLEISKELMLLNVGKKDWLVKPKSLPIEVENDYTVKVLNPSEGVKPIKLMSYYGLPRVINIEIFDSSNNLVETFCISKLRKKFRTFEVQPNSFLTIKICYRKKYEKADFLNAGRLRIEGV